jgi:hypothetical protein
MEVEIKKIDWKETLDEKMKNLKIKPIDLEKKCGRKNFSKNFARKYYDPDKVSIDDLIELSELMDHNFFYDFCNIEEINVSGVKSIIGNESKDELNLILANMLKSKEDELKELKAKLDLLKKTGT